MAGYEDNREYPTFLTIPFDWYILERWQSSDPLEDSQQRREKHIQLGMEYAALGHEGRRPYILKALEWQNGGQNTNTLPRSLVEVPTDLLTATERKICHPEYTQEPFWLRTNYGPATDARFEELIQGYGDHVPSLISVASDSERYGIMEENLQTMFAFFPAMIQSDALQYLDDWYDFGSDYIQDALFSVNRRDTIAEEDRLAQEQTCFFITDDEGMRTGFVRWIFTDQYGTPLFDERIQPWSMEMGRGLRREAKRTLQEFRYEISRGWYGDDQRRSDTIVGPWEPPR